MPEVRPEGSPKDGASIRDVQEKQSERQDDRVKDVVPESVQNPYFTNSSQPQNYKRKLPPWLDHFNAKDLKTLFKCSVAVWLQTVLILINPSFKVLGTAAFVGCLVLFIAPPAGILFVQLMATTSILLGIALAWAWGVIIMKVALAARPAGFLEDRLGLLQEMAQHVAKTKNLSATEVKDYEADQIYSGFMLNTRVTITYYCMMGIFIYLVARLRVATPKLIFVQMLGVIVSNVFLTEAPLLPKFDGTIAKILVVPCAIAAGVGVVCNILIFPTSSSSVVLDDTRMLLAQMPAFLDACFLSFKYPGLTMSMEMLVGTKMKILVAYKALDPAMMFLLMDVSIGRWSSGDMYTLKEPLRRVVISFIALLEVHRTNEEFRGKDAEALSMAEATHNGTTNVQSANKPGHHQIARAVDFRLKSRGPSEDDLIKKSFQALAGSSKGLIDACKGCITAIQEALAHSNSLKRSNGHEEMILKRIQVLEKLREHRDAFVGLKAQHLVETHSHLFDDDGFLNIQSDHFSPLRGLMLGILFEDRLLQLANALEKLLARIVELESTRTKTRLWLPNRLMDLLKWISRSDASETPKSKRETTNTSTPVSASNPEDISSGDEPDNSPEPKSAQDQLIAMRIPNSRKRTKTSQILLRITHWFGCTESIFAFRVLVVTLALCVPAVIRSSSGFYYREKGLWAVIMAQLALVPYTADLIYGVVVRVVGTVLGGVIGLVAWYIGSGSGPGNPYGLAAIMAVVIVLLMWLRLFTPPSLMPASIVMAATAYLVFSYSWADTHLPTYGNPGVGYSVFWRRLVLVLVGFSAAVIVTFLPRPPSANRHYRRLLADSLTSVRDRYALFASNWADPASDLREVTEREALMTGELLFSIVEPIKITGFEFSTSNFDAATLGRVCHLCMILNQSVTQLLLYTDRIPADHRLRRIVPSTGAVDADLIAELMAVLSLAQQSLKTGDPLPAILPTPLLARSIAFARQQVKEEGARNRREGTEDRGDDGLFLFVRDKLGDDAFRRYVVVLNSLVQLLGAVDELILVLKRTAGETSDVTSPLATV